MTSFFISYNRRTGDLDLKPFLGQDGRAEALRARLKADFARSNADLEYVVIESSSEAALRRTHRRYFESLERLADA